MRIAFDDYIKSIQKGDLPDAVLCLGEEIFFYEEILKALRQKFAGTASWGLETYDASNLDPARLFASAGTLSFDGGTKVTVIRNAAKLKDGQLEALGKITSHPSKERRVVLMAEKALRKTDKLLAWCKQEKITLCPLETPKSRELGVWVREQARKRGFSIDGETMSFILDLASGNLLAISRMLDKIDLYRGDKGSLGFTDIEDLLHDSYEKGIFDCVKAVFASRNQQGKIVPQKRETASCEMHRVLRFNPNDGILNIVRMLSREAFALLKYHELKKKGASREEIAKSLSLGPRKWLLEKEYPSRVAGWSTDRLHRLLIRLAEVDLAVRISGRDAEAMLEQVIIGNLSATSVEEFDEIFV